jgi:hypothetical protein
VLFGPHIHAPLVGDGLITMSDCQQARVKFAPSLCPALSDRPRALTACVSSQPTQCINTADRHRLKSLFPISYGSPLVSIDVGAEVEEIEDVGGDYSQRKRRKTLSREPSAPLTVGVCFCGRQAPGGHDIIAGMLNI